MIFEEKAQIKLRDLFADAYLASPGLSFRDAHGFHRCVPDGIIVHREGPYQQARVCLVEIKLTHTPNAWWQLRKLYGPVVKHYFGADPLVLEIVKQYEPSVPFPERVTVVYEIFDFVLNAKPSEFGVLRWKL